ncbi:general transcription factor II-I repeat domain-containing protein 2-like [Metopolophium dirhodum]|uniref:general transcription factor II-I repeat domain-containing protein 2-like n=1 Tax=Metopolophium dirhodum TaxID=44670 RepID=UPI00298FDC4A|nr:general transcription factor II-I repeat domain-containing protein 2-like [Metopolophium dirhodum]
MFLSFLSDLGEEFGKRFKDFAEIGKLSQFLKNLFEVSPTGEWIDVATKLFRLPKSSLQMEIIDLQEDISLQMNKTLSTEDFWIKHVLDKYINCKTLAIKLATMFGSTYVCETSFSKMTFLKNRYRSRLTDHRLENTLRISCSPRVPDLKKLAQEKKCHFSH